ncbi:hypothetical protein CVT26_012314 [Gymnopilus dilepis]|uniref:Uncharacterized protein n=1 Tax=Gymnopilus dilepis TaxID=231916 RepID=A0A409WMQ1_9AGAR|nr:hypothetical protein CVT26_012314 [Gymnopilus dilepis]
MSTSSRTSQGKSFKILPYKQSFSETFHLMRVPFSEVAPGSRGTNTIGHLKITHLSQQEHQTSKEHN